MPVMHSLVASLLSGALATTAGAVPVLVMRRLSRASENTLMGFGAGVMLAAASFSLLVPGIDHARASGGGRLSVAVVGLGFALGGALIGLGHRYFPHEHFFKGAEGPPVAKLSRIWLFVFAIAFHNLPEGLSVGVAFAAGDTATSLPLALGIAAQNVPEGLVVAIALASAGYSRLRALSVAAATGFVEPLGALAGHVGVGLASAALPLGFGLAAGAMVFVVSDEIIPESHAGHEEGRATLGLMAGFLLLLGLDVLID